MNYFDYNNNEPARKAFAVMSRHKPDCDRLVAVLHPDEHTPGITPGTFTMKPKRPRWPFVSLLAVTLIILITT